MRAWLRNRRPNETSKAIAWQTHPSCNEKCKVKVGRFSEESVNIVLGLKHSETCLRKERKRRREAA